MKNIFITAIRSCLLITVFIFTCSQSIYAQEGLKKIADNVYSYSDVKGGSPQNSFGANAGIIIGKDGIVVIDTLTSSKEAGRFINDIKAVSDKPVTYVVNTHYHLDHSFGNADFADLGARIISHINCRDSIMTRGEAALKGAANYGFTEDDMKGTRIAYPELTFNSIMELDTGVQTVKLIYLNHAHTDGDIIVYLPEEKVMFTGDILFTGYHPFMADGYIDQWVKVLDYILTMDVDTIIPGHGPISSKEDIVDMRNYIIAFDKKAKELAAMSDDLEYIVSEIKKAVPERPEGHMLIPANIQMKYLSQQTK